MKKFYYLFISLLFLFSCKNDNNSNHNIKTNETVYINQDSINNTINDTLLIKLPENIKKLYKTFDDKIIWSSFENRKDLLENIAKCSEDGLFSENYEFEKLKTLEKNRNQLNYYDIQKYDIYLCKAFNNLSNNLKRGIINPKEIYSNWDVPFRNAIEIDKLANAIKNATINTFLIENTANNNSYKTL